MALVVAEADVAFAELVAVVAVVAEELDVAECGTVLTWTKMWTRKTM